MVIDSSNDMISVITCTNRLDYSVNILCNYKRQTYKNKELIVVLNNDSLVKSDWEKKFNKYNNIRILQIDESISLGKCLNYAIQASRGNIVAKLDDDDYYGPNYLSTSINYLKNTEASIVGKSTSFVYFEKNRILALRNLGKENRYVNRVEGPTLIIDKNIFEKVSFSDVSLGEDVQFCKECFNKGYKIYSADRFNHVYIRHSYKNNHTWKIGDDLYLKLCHVVAKTDSYEKFVNQ